MQRKPKADADAVLTQARLLPAQQQHRLARTLLQGGRVDITLTAQPKTGVAPADVELGRLADLRPVLPDRSGL